MNNSSTFYDNQLKEIPHYRNFPVMQPYVGKNYKINSLKILLIGESHYLPPGATISQNPEKWYQLTQRDLTKDEIAYINTRNILSGNWKPAGHMLFRELENRMAKFYDISKSRAMTNVAFMNGFQRPAPIKGGSLRKSCKPIDCKIGDETIKKVIEFLKPNLVIFVSKFAWDKLRSDLPKQRSTLKYEFVCHPGTGGRYWHNKNYKHGAKKFDSVLARNN